jgi:hypothetical protein
MPLSVTIFMTDIVDAQGHVDAVNSTICQISRERKKATVKSRKRIIL